VREIMLIEALPADLTDGADAETPADGADPVEPLDDAEPDAGDGDGATRDE
jgi:hypothetical protein